MRDPPCTYCPNLSSKFHHLTPTQPSNSLPFLQLVTEHSLRIKGFRTIQSVLGLLLFLTYINDMTNCVQFSECRIYADNSLLCYNESLQGPINLQEDVTSMQQWALTWGMYFNVKKCAHTFIGRQVSDIENLLLNNEKM